MLCCMSRDTAPSPPAETRRGTRLDRAMILRAAQRVCDEEGLAALTLRRLGRELGVDATAMYRHFASKADLLSALIDDLFLREVRPPEPERAWRDNLRDIIVDWWKLYRRHEGLSQAMAGQPDDEPQLFHITEWTVRELMRAGISQDQLGLFYQTIYNFTVGNGLVAAFSPWLTVAELRDEQRRVYAALDPARFPSAATAAPFIYPENEKVFLFSVELILDAVEAKGGGAECEN